MNEWLKLLQEFEDTFEIEIAFTEEWSYDIDYFWDVAGVKVVERLRLNRGKTHHLMILEVFHHSSSSGSWLRDL